MKVLHKFQLNFTMRHILSCDLQFVEQSYIQGLFDFTMGIFGDQTVSSSQKELVLKEVSFYLNIIWFRVHVELSSMKTTSAHKVGIMIQ